MCFLAPIGPQEEGILDLCLSVYFMEFSFVVAFKLLMNKMQLIMSFLFFCRLRITFQFIR